MRILTGMLLTATLAACGGSDVAGPTRAHDVLLAMTAPGPCVSGLCDPGGNDDVLALIQVVNHGSATAYLQACGTFIDLGVQRFVNGTWESVGPAILCALPSTPIALEPGDTVQTNRSFEPGRWRAVLGVASTADLSDVALSTSGTVIVF